MTLQRNRKQVVSGKQITVGGPAPGSKRAHASGISAGSKTIPPHLCCCRLFCSSAQQRPSRTRSRSATESTSPGNWLGCTRGRSASNRIAWVCYRFRPERICHWFVSGNVVIRTADGKEYEGAMRAGAGGMWSLSTVDNTQRVDIKPSDVASIIAATDAENSSAEAAIVATTARKNVWEGAKDRPGLIGPWSIDSRIAFSGVNSTKSRRLLHWNGELDNSTHIGTLKLTAERIYSVSTGPTGREFLDDDLTRGEANFTKDVSERTAIYGDFEGLHDVVRFVDKRLTPCRRRPVQGA